jgi:putative transcriptional regulator
VIPLAAGLAPAACVGIQAGTSSGRPRDRQLDLAFCQAYLTLPGASDHSWGMATRPVARLLNRLRVARAERDLSQDQLAQAASVSRQTISSIETGQYCPSTLLAFRLARVLGVRVDELFWLEGES